MIGSNARRNQGPPGWSRAAPCVLVACAVTLAACAAPSAPLPSASPAMPAAPDEARLALWQAGLAGRRPDSAAAVAMRAAGLTPPFGRRFANSLGGRTIVAGILPGGRPIHRDSVLVAVGVGQEGAAALLEAAYMLSARSAFVAGPQRSLLIGVVFDGSGRPVPSAAAAASLLSAPLWAPEAVTGLVAVGPGGAGAVAVAEQRMLGFTAVERQPASSLASLAREAYETLLERSRQAPAALRTVVPDTAGSQAGRR